jgi:methylamine---glutamate N-methyltransferase subunit A
MIVLASWHVRPRLLGAEGCKGRADMCGIIGLRLKNPDLRPILGKLAVPMVEVLSSRGPDSTGVAIYSRDAPAGAMKYSLSAPADGYDWDGYLTAVQAAAGASGEAPAELRRKGRDAILVTSCGPERVRRLLAAADPAVRLFGYGAAIEVYKDVGPAAEVCARYGVAGMAGYQAIGHTRMATESAVTTEHSHPFAVAADLALVHNGSFSNYASVRRDLADQGVEFDTDNDSEVAARYVAREMDAGADLADALRGVLKAFDGFFTLLVTTERSFAVVRDSFACKPMVVAETPDYIAVASEYIALADLPGVEKAKVFEPMPEEIYTWQE